MNTSETGTLPATRERVDGIRDTGLTIQPGFLGTLRGHWRMTVQASWRGTQLVRLLLQMLVLPVLVGITVRAYQDFAYVMWMLNTYLFLVVPIVCLTVAGALIRDEVQEDTLGFFLTRPTTRGRLYLAKFLCQVGRLQLIFAVETLLLVLVGAFRGIEGVGPFGLLLLGTQALAIPGWCALSGLFGLITRKYVMLGVFYGALVEIGFGLIPTNLNNLSLFHHAKVLLSQHPLVGRLDGLLPGTEESLPLSLGILAGAPVLLAGMGMVVFTWREYHYSDEMQK